MVPVLVWLDVDCLVIILTNCSTEDDSPYPEVRSAVANFDDDTMPVSTIRAWVLGMCGAIVLPGVNQFFYYRYPGIVVGSVRNSLNYLNCHLILIPQLVAQLMVFPIGRAWARIVPSIKIFGHSLNTGPFTIKEHVQFLFKFLSIPTSYCL